MIVSITENYYEGSLKDERGKSLSKSYGTGVLRLGNREGIKVARFTRYFEGKDVDIIPPLWRAEVAEIDGKRMLITGLQRLNARSPLHYQEWWCWCQEKDA